MRFPDHFLDEIRARIALSAIIARKVEWDARKSNAARGEYWACCPFHHEKTASFHVEDGKGRYHCFGCKASGDHFTFLIEIEKATFPEAVEQLAREAGLSLPNLSPEDVKRERTRGSLYKVLETAAAFYRGELAGDAGAGARAYLAQRGVPEAQWKDYDLGYAPAARGSLFAAMKAAGIADALVIEAGLGREGVGGNPPAERMRDRIMFPIHDRQGRPVGFGGRYFGADDQVPKYLNSPETPLFSKRLLLYNHHRAKDFNADEARELVVCEGYLDALAIARVELPHVVAPLGTALSGEQFLELWRLVDEPVICLDGDDAGRKAAQRILATALPLLAPGKSLRFVTLPENKDPDEIIAAGGRTGFDACLAGARPLLDFMWDELAQAADVSTPERCAKFQISIIEAAAKIADVEVRKAYEGFLAGRLKAFWKDKGIRQPGARFDKPPKAARGAGGGHDGDRRDFGKDEIDEINRSYAVVITGQKAAILMDSAADVAGVIERTRFMNVDAFRLWLANKLARVDGRYRSHADLWLESAQRRQYRGIEFTPAPPGKSAARDGFFNLWRGFDVEPKENMELATPWLDHIENNLAGSDSELFNWIVSWFAWMVQFPRKRLGISLALKGGEGVGKTITGKIFGSLMPANYFLIDEPRYLTGQFNAHLASCLFLQADESFWAGDKQAEGRLKGLITSDIQMIEYKGVDPIRLPNYVSLMISSNEEWIVPVSLRGRRFAVVDVTGRRIQDHKYFAEFSAIYERPDARAALLYSLLHWRIDEAVLRKVPGNAALWSQKLRSLDHFTGWLYEFLMQGGLNPGALWPDWVKCADLHKHYLKRCERLGLRHPHSIETFGRRLGYMLPGLQHKRVVERGTDASEKARARPWCYLFPKLVDARAAFEEQADYAVNWEGDGIFVEEALSKIDPL